MKTAKHVYRAHVIDRLGNDNQRTVATTRWYMTWESAQHAGEALCNRKYGRGNQRYMVSIED